MTHVQDIIDAADPSTQEGIDNLAAQVNQELATRIAEKIFSMDHFSAQLRLIYAARLRDGHFDAGAIKIMHTHLREVWFLAETMMREVEFLIPTITNEPATAPEKEQLL